jgi:hypothetical protein
MSGHKEKNEGEEDCEEEDDYPEEPPELKALHKINNEINEEDEKKVTGEEEIKNGDEERGENLNEVQNETKEMLDEMVEIVFFLILFCKIICLLKQKKVIDKKENLDGEVLPIKIINEEETQQYSVVHSYDSKPENEDELSGVYSEELAHILYGAAIKIQSAWRGLVFLIYCVF